MSPLFTLVLFVGGVVGGALNAVAGGGSFIVFPIMLLGGIAPVVANATTAVALWPAGLSSVGAYRRELSARDRAERRVMIVLGVVSALGGGLGAQLLLITSEAMFAKLLPFLMLAAASIFTLGPRLTRRREGSLLPLAAGAFIQLLISTYGGYFGGGMGIMMLSTLTLVGMTHIHKMNALKVVFSLLINGVALVSFFIARKVNVGAALPVAVGAIVGGWSGASIARRVAPGRVRQFVLFIAWALTAWFFARGYL